MEEGNKHFDALYNFEVVDECSNSDSDSNQEGLFEREPYQDPEIVRKPTEGEIDAFLENVKGLVTSETGPKDDPRPNTVLKEYTEEDFIGTQPSKDLFSGKRNIDVVDDKLICTITNTSTPRSGVTYKPGGTLVKTIINESIALKETIEPSIKKHVTTDSISPQVRGEDFRNLAHARDTLRVRPELDKENYDVREDSEYRRGHSMHRRHGERRSKSRDPESFRRSKSRDATSFRRSKSRDPASFRRSKSRDPASFRRSKSRDAASFRRSKSQDASFRRSKSRDAASFRRSKSRDAASFRRSKSRDAASFRRSKSRDAASFRRSKSRDESRDRRALRHRSHSGSREFLRHRSRSRSRERRRSRRSRSRSRGRDSRRRRSSRSPNVISLSPTPTRDSVPSNKVPLVLASTLPPHFPTYPLENVYFGQTVGLGMQQYPGSMPSGYASTSLTASMTTGFGGTSLATSMTASYSSTSIPSYGGFPQTSLSGYPTRTSMAGGGFPPLHPSAYSGYYPPNQVGEADPWGAPPSYPPVADPLRKSDDATGFGMRPSAGLWNQNAPYQEPRLVEDSRSGRRRSSSRGRSRSGSKSRSKSHKKKSKRSSKSPSRRSSKSKKAKYSGSPPTPTFGIPDRKTTYGTPDERPSYGMSDGRTTSGIPDRRPRMVIDPNRIPTPPPPPILRAHDSISAKVNEQRSTTEKPSDNVKQIIEKDNVSLSSLLQAVMETSGVGKSKVSDPEVKKEILNNCETKIQELYKKRISGIGAFIPDAITPRMINSKCSPLILFHPHLSFNEEPADNTWKCPDIAVPKVRLLEQDQIKKLPSQAGVLQKEEPKPAVARVPPTNNFSSGAVPLSKRSGVLGAFPPPGVEKLVFPTSPPKMVPPVQAPGVPLGVPPPVIPPQQTQYNERPPLFSEPPPMTNMPPPITSVPPPMVGIPPPAQPLYQEQTSTYWPNYSTTGFDFPPPAINQNNWASGYQQQTDWRTAMQNVSLQTHNQVPDRPSRPTRPTPGRQFLEEIKNVAYPMKKLEEAPPIPGVDMNERWGSGSPRRRSRSPRRRSRSPRRRSRSPRRRSRSPRRRSRSPRRRSPSPRRRSPRRSRSPRRFSPGRRRSPRRPSPRRSSPRRPSSPRRVPSINRGPPPIHPIKTLTAPQPVPDNSKYYKPAKHNPNLAQLVLNPKPSPSPVTPIKPGETIVVDLVNDDSESENNKISSNSLRNKTTNTVSKDVPIIDLESPSKDAKESANKSKLNVDKESTMKSNKAFKPPVFKKLENTNKIPSAINELSAVKIESVKKESINIESVNIESVITDMPFSKMYPLREGIRAIQEKSLLYKSIIDSLVQANSRYKQLYCIQKSMLCKLETMGPGVRVVIPRDNLKELVLLVHKEYHSVKSDIIQNFIRLNIYPLINAAKLRKIYDTTIKECQECKTSSPSVGVNVLPPETVDKKSPSLPEKKVEKIIPKASPVAKGGIQNPPKRENTVLFNKKPNIPKEKDNQMELSKPDDGRPTGYEKATKSKSFPKKSSPLVSVPSNDFGAAVAKSAPLAPVVENNEKLVFGAPNKNSPDARKEEPSQEPVKNMTQDSRQSLGQATDTNAVQVPLQEPTKSSPSNPTQKPDDNSTGSVKQSEQPQSKGVKPKPETGNSNPGPENVKPSSDSTSEPKSNESGQASINEKPKQEAGLDFKTRIKNLQMQTPELADIMTKLQAKDKSVSGNYVLKAGMLCKKEGSEVRIFAPPSSVKEVVNIVHTMAATHIPGSKVTTFFNKHFAAVGNLESIINELVSECQHCKK